jgi:hypothetical protein
LGECTVELLDDFRYAKLENCVLKFPKTDLPLMLPAFPGQVRGVLTTEISVVI